MALTHMIRTTNRVGTIRKTDVVEGKWSKRFYIATLQNDNAPHLGLLVR